MLQGQHRVGLTLLCIISALILTSSHALAMNLRRQVVSGGITQGSAGSYAIRGTVGESGPVSGIAETSAFRLGAGFWHGYNQIPTSDAWPPQAGLQKPTNELHQNWPNPFQGPTSIVFALAHPSEVELAVYDVSGRLVRMIASGRHDAGRYRVEWDGRSAGGIPVPDGVYFYRLELGAWHETRKMLMIR